MSSVKSETETVIKKILPYLKRRGYNPEVDFDYEVSVAIDGKTAPGKADLVVRMGKRKPLFIVEAKKNSKVINDKDRDQALAYGRTLGTPFVVVTNGRDIKSYNTKSGGLIKWSGTTDKLPSAVQIADVVKHFKSKPDSISVSLGKDETLPYRPGLPLKQINSLFQRCHNAIRKIEKNEENAFSDFSKLLFLKLLEEKSESDSSFKLPYSYRFHTLANMPESNSDQIESAIKSMISSIRNEKSYGEVLEDDIKLKNSKTFRYIVIQLASVSFQDSSIDSKGAAFEYFVRATLKGKKLGQYFTPRPVIQLMLSLIGKEKIVNTVLSGTKIKVLDPSCGTGGFLVYMMQESLKVLDEKLANRMIDAEAYSEAKKKIREETFYGSDANPGVAASAKMNMIIAGDGHSNIKAEDSLSKKSENWSTSAPDCNIIMANPPFGTSESLALTQDDKDQFDLQTAKGQLLFIQKMIKSTKPGCDICTVIDDGVLNTDLASGVRRLILENCKVLAVVRLPEDTFKPNKINVKSSVLYLQKLENPDVDLDNNYLIPFYSIESLGYIGSGDEIRGFKLNLLLEEISQHNIRKMKVNSGYHWSAFLLNSRDVFKDPTYRLDLKYWDPYVTDKITKNPTKYVAIKEVASNKIRRGKSPSPDLYVDKEDGYALVLKSGTNISKFGEVIESGDYIEKDVYDDYDSHHLKSGDILIASTGDGTLGKCAVYRSSTPAIPDSHVTVIRLDQKKFYPEYVAAYIRIGFGNKQIERLYTGSTGLIELTPEHIGRVVLESKVSLSEQKRRYNEIKKIEDEYTNRIKEAEIDLMSRSDLLD